MSTSQLNSVISQPSIEG